MLGMGLAEVGSGGKRLADAAARVSFSRLESDAGVEARLAAYSEWLEPAHEGARDIDPTGEPVAAAAAARNVSRNKQTRQSRRWSRFSSNDAQVGSVLSLRPELHNRAVRCSWPSHLP